MWNRIKSSKSFNRSQSSEGPTHQVASRHYKPLSIVLVELIRLPNPAAYLFTFGLIRSWTPTLLPRYKSENPCDTLCRLSKIPNTLLHTICSVGEQSTESFTECRAFNIHQPFSTPPIAGHSCQVRNYPAMNSSSTPEKEESWGGDPICYFRRVGGCDCCPANLFQSYLLTKSQLCRKKIKNKKFREGAIESGGVGGR